LPYQIDFRPSALKAYNSLPHPEQRRIERAIDTLATQHRPAGAKKLMAELNLWRIRVASYRIIYQIEDDKLLILVVKIGHRKDVYR
jgi:mRNA interferase RelE/StbE